VGMVTDRGDLEVQLVRGAAHHDQVDVTVLEERDGLLAVADLEAYLDVRVRGPERGKDLRATYLAVLTAPKTTRPPDPLAMASRVREQRATSASMRAVASASSRPASVGRKPSPVRSMRGRPVLRSRRRSCWLTAGGVTCRTWAAAAMVPWSSVAASDRSCFSVTSRMNKP